MADKVEIHGHCDSQFSSVKKAFASNFEAGLEVGASFAATVDGKFVVDRAGYASSMDLPLPISTNGIRFRTVQP